MITIKNCKNDKMWTLTLTRDNKEDEKLFNKMISAESAYKALSDILDLLAERDDIHFEIHKIITDSNIDTSLL